MFCFPFLMDSGNSQQKYKFYLIYRKLKVGEITYNIMKAHFVWNCKQY